jgi:hypothetical protein
MTAMATGEPLTGEFDDEFDLDIRIDDLNPAEPDRIHRAATFGTSCTMCCPGEVDPTLVRVCVTHSGCTEYSDCLCTGDPC